MIANIKANFKELQIKSGTAVMKLEVLPTAKGFTELTKMTGHVVFLQVETEQEEIPFEEQEVEEQEAEEIPFAECEYEQPKPANVDCETGEVYEVIEDEARMIGEGNGVD